jgi:hypothetical protein
LRIIELSNKKPKNGRRKFKAVLHRIFPDECIVDETGTQHNDNGITWIREYCEKALPTIQGMSLRCEFVDPDNRVEILGHGETEIVSDLQLFENATLIGNFVKGYIAEIELDGELQTVCIAEGEIDEACYKSFVEKLEQDLSDGYAPYGSVEIYRTADNDSIVYKYGYKDYGRVPMEFIYSGFALLGVKPADKSAKLLELNNKKEESIMDEKMLQGFVTDIKLVISETNSKNDELSKTISELNEAIADKDKTISELNTSADELKTALEKAEEERKDLWKKEDEIYNEIKILKEQLAEAQAKERVGEMNSAIVEFSDEEKSYAKDEIESFKSDPTSCEINSIVDKIWAVIGKKAKETEKVISEQNSTSNNEVDDIFAEVSEINSVDNDDSIF